jgi:steroid delta-isomerase-like uncharacterized protein
MEPGGWRARRLAMAAEIAELIARLLQAWNAQDVEAIAACYAADYIGEDVAQATPQCGSRGASAAAADYLRAFPDLQITGETVIEDQRVALVWMLRGTHKEPFLRVPPSGRSIAVRGVSVLTVQGGRIIHSVCVWDVAGFLRAIGLLPAL